MFGEYLKTLRKAKGFRLREFAQAIDISASYLSDIEKGNRNAPGYELLCRMKKSLDLGEDAEQKFHALALNDSCNLPPDIIAKIKECPELLQIIRDFNKCDILR